MNKLSITTFALTVAIAAAANAATTTATTTTAAVNSTPAQLTAAEPAAGKKKMMHKHHRMHHGKALKGKMAPVVAENSENQPYSEIRVGDPRIVYHEIGTAGAQNGNTIVPMYDEPIRSSKPYEIRYDYAEFRDNAK